MTAPSLRKASAELAERIDEHAQEIADRYYMIEIDGYRITPGTLVGSTSKGISISILDRHINHREVARFTSGIGRSDTHIRRKAREECDYLNGLERGHEVARLDPYSRRV